MSLSRVELLALDDLPTRDVPVPDNWGGTVRVRCLSAAERLEFGMASQKKTDGEPGPDPASLLVALAVIDETGAQLFQVQDVDVLASKRGDVIEDIAQAVLRLSKLTPEDDNASAVEVAKGNSAAAQSGATPSDSPDNSDAPSPN